MFDFIEPQLYSTVYTLFMCSLSFIMAFYYTLSTNNERIVSNKPISQGFAWLLLIATIVFIGWRPVSGWFGDMTIYSYVYNNFYGDWSYDNERGEYLFYWMGEMCKQSGFSENNYFLLLAAIYFGFMAATCWRLMRRNLLIALLFCLVSFSCFAYGTNGMRNGLACSIVMFALTFIRSSITEKLIAVLLMFAAYEIHKTTALPSICAIFAFYWIKNPKYAIGFWIASIFISLFAGNYITDVFVNLGFDERLEKYTNITENNEIQLAVDPISGFRVDFIIYSIMPVIMAWYVTIKRNFKDQTYNLLATTYILSNAFWIIVIRSNFSNRFAYLSWFLYPIVIAYPLLRMNMWEDQDRKTALVLMVYAGFTLMMQFVYYA